MSKNRSTSIPGLQDKGLRSLCEILSQSEGAPSSLLVLRVGPPYDQASFGIGTFSLLVQCVRNLTSLEVLEIKGLTPGQSESLSKVSFFFRVRVRWGSSICNESRSPVPHMQFAFFVAGMVFG